MIQKKINQTKKNKITGVKNITTKPRDLRNSKNLDHKENKIASRKGIKNNVPNTYKKWNFSLDEIIIDKINKITIIICDFIKQNTPRSVSNIYNKVISHFKKLMSDRKLRIKTCKSNID